MIKYKITNEAFDFNDNTLNTDDTDDVINDVKLSVDNTILIQILKKLYGLTLYPSNIEELEFDTLHDIGTCIKYMTHKPISIEQWTLVSCIYYAEKIEKLLSNYTGYNFFEYRKVIITLIKKLTKLLLHVDDISDYSYVYDLRLSRDKKCLIIETLFIYDANDNIVQKIKNWVIIDKDIDIESSVYFLEHPIDESFDFAANYNDDNELTKDIAAAARIALLQKEKNLPKLLLDYYGVYDFKKLPSNMTDDKYGLIFSAIPFDSKELLAPYIAAKYRFSDKNMHMLVCAGFKKYCDDIDNMRIKEQFIWDALDEIFIKLGLKKFTSFKKQSYEIYVAPDNGLIIINGLGAIEYIPDEEYHLQSMAIFTGKVIYSLTNKKSPEEIQKQFEKNQALDFIRKMAESSLIIPQLPSLSRYSATNILPEELITAYMTKDGHLFRFIGNEYLNIHHHDFEMILHINDSIQTPFKILKKFCSYHSNIPTVKTFKYDIENNKPWFIAEYEDVCQTLEILITNNVSYLKNRLQNDNINLYLCGNETFLYQKGCSAGYKTDIYAVIIMSDLGMKIYNKVKDNKKISEATINDTLTWIKSNQ